MELNQMAQLVIDQRAKVTEALGLAHQAYQLLQDVRNQLDLAYSKGLQTDKAGQALHKSAGAWSEQGKQINRIRELHKLLGEV